MNQTDIQLFRSSVDKNIIIYCTDGEIISAKLDLISEHDGEIVYQMLATNRPSKPAYGGDGIGKTFLMRFEDVESLSVYTH